jgi:hypothetical protein
VDNAIQNFVRAAKIQQHAGYVTPAGVSKPEAAPTPAPSTGYGGYSRSSQTGPQQQMFSYPPAGAMLDSGDTLQNGQTQSFGAPSTGSGRFTTVGAVGDGRSVSPKLRFDPFAPVLSRSVTAPAGRAFFDQGQSPNSGGGGLFGYSSLTSAQQQVPASRLGAEHLPSQSHANNGSRGISEHPAFSKVWGKPTGLTATSVWG